MERRNIEDIRDIKIGYYLRWLWAEASAVRGRILLRAIVGGVNVALSLLFVWLSKSLIDIATGDNESSLWWAIAAMVCCVVGQIYFSTLGIKMETDAEVVLKNSLRQKHFSHIMDSRWVEGRLHSGDVINRLVEDITSIANALCVVLPSFLTTGVQFVAAFTFLSLLNVRLAGVLVLIMPLFLLFSKRYMRRIRLYTSDIRSMDGRVQTHMQEYMRHRVLVSAMEYTPHVKEDLDAMHVDLREKVMRRTDYTLFSRRMIQAGFMGGYMVAFLWGIFGLREGVITFGMMTAFLQLVGQIQRPVLELSHQLPTFIHITTSVDRLSELTNMPLEQQGKAIALDGKVGVRLQGVTFSYEGNRDEVLHDFSCDFRPGSLTAVLGRTGAGKSTLVRIILGLLIPQRGSVEMYNDGRTEPVSPLTRCNVAYVPQGNSLVSGTVRSNLLLGNPTASEEQMLKALHTAVADFVLELPDGLDTLCGEGGTAFSEGQAQRIAIARGLLRERSIVLMDEPTAALDVVTEQLLLERLGEYSRHRTLIIVTHHGATAKLCNAVVSVG